MTDSLADKIRRYVNEAFIEPARKQGLTQVTVKAGDVHKDLKLQGRMPAVCGALDAGKFQEQFGVVLSRRSGPKQGATATWIFSMQN